MDADTDALLDRLNDDPEVTEGQVLLFLSRYAAEGAATGGSVLHPDQFWQLGDLARFRAAEAWWPRDAPPQCRLGRLGDALRSIVVPAGLTPLPFMARTELLWRRACEWLTSEGRSIADPNESPEDRKKRLGREAVARHRRTRAAAVVDPRAAEVSRLHAAYIEACRVRRAAAAAHDATVAAAKLAWEAAKADLAG